MDKKRYEKEIEEILAKYDQESGRKERPKSEGPSGMGGIGGGFRPSAARRGNAPRRKQPSFTSGLKNFSAGQYMIAAFVLAILAIFVRPISPPIAGVMVILAAALFLVPLLLHRSPSSSRGAPHEEKRWRGQVIDMSTRRDITNDPFAAIKRWFKRR